MGLGWPIEKTRSALRVGIPPAFVHDDQKRRRSSLQVLLANLNQATLSVTYDRSEISF